MDALENMAMSKQVIDVSRVVHTTFKQQMQDADKVQDMLDDVNDLVRGESESERAR